VLGFTPTLDQVRVVTIAFNTSYVTSFLKMVLSSLFRALAAAPQQ
jgi:hypothetical protein